MHYVPFHHELLRDASVSVEILFVELRDTDYVDDEVPNASY